MFGDHSPIKCIVYISRVAKKKNGVSVPSGLSDIFNYARAFNKKSGITGIFTYRDGFYLQVLEGNPLDVDALYAWIRADDRHHNVETIFDLLRRKRMFGQWSMKLLAAIEDDQTFRDFIAEHNQNMGQLSVEKRELLRKFCHFDQKDNKVSPTFSGHSLQLLRWPDFSQTPKAEDIMGLCAYLMGRAVNYEDLISDESFGSKHDVDRVLRSLAQQDILVAKASTSGHAPANTLAPPDGFYNKMLRLFGVGHRTP